MYSGIMSIPTRLTESIQRAKTMQEIERISNRILTIRGQRVMVDADLATLYGVTTRRRIGFVQD